MLYSIDPVPAYEQTIREYLTRIGRRVPASCFVIVGAGGSTQMIAAFYWAAAIHHKRHSKSRKFKLKLNVQSSIPPPYYALHQQICDTVQGCRWISWEDSRRRMDLQVIVSPNNPNGTIQSPTITDPSRQFILLDFVYDTPQFTGGYETVNPWTENYLENPDSLFGMVGSLSKLGLAGLRVGFLITPNAELAANVVDYVQRTSLGTNTWAMNFAISNLNALYLNMFWFDKTIYDELQYRQAVLRQLIPNHLILSLTNVPFLFLQLPPELFERQGIRVRNGASFGVDPLRYCRLQLMVSYQDFPILFTRIKDLHLNNNHEQD